MHNLQYRNGWMDAMTNYVVDFITSTTRKLKTAYVGVHYLHIEITTRSLKAACACCCCWGVSVYRSVSVTCSTNLPSYGSSNHAVASQKWAAGCDIGAPALARSALSAAAPSHQQIASRYHRAQYLPVLARCGGEIVGLAGVGRKPPYRPAHIAVLLPCAYE